MTTTSACNTFSFDLLFRNPSSVRPQRRAKVSSDKPPRPALPAPKFAPSAGRISPVDRSTKVPAPPSAAGSKISAAYGRWQKKTHVLVRLLETRHFPARRELIARKNLAPPRGIRASARTSSSTGTAVVRFLCFRRRRGIQTRPFPVEGVVWPGLDRTFAACAVQPRALASLCGQLVHVSRRRRRPVTTTNIAGVLHKRLGSPPPCSCCFSPPLPSTRDSSTLLAHGPTWSPRDTVRVVQLVLARERRALRMVVSEVEGGVHGSFAERPLLLSLLLILSLSRFLSFHGYRFQSLESVDGDRVWDNTRGRAQSKLIVEELT